MYACSLKWKNEWIEKDTLKSMLKLLSDYIQPALHGRDSIGISHGLHFTGGEPFLNYELLLFACEAAILAEAFETYFGWEVYHHEG